MGYGSSYPSGLGNQSDRQAVTGSLTLTPTQTLASAASLAYNGFSIPATTLTLTGTTQVTTATGLNLASIAAPTYTDSSAVTVDLSASLYIGGPPTAGGSVTLTSAYALWIDSGNLRLDGNLDLSAAAANIVGKANTAAALNVTDGTTSLIAIDTRNTVSVCTHTIQGPASQTLANGATARSRTVSIAAKTVTLAGQTQVTTLNEGSQLEILAPTYNQSGGAVTVDKVSTLFVGTPVAGASVTITTNHIIMTGTAGCFCTAAGTWTDTSSELSKENIRSADLAELPELIDSVDVVKFKKIDKSDGDFDRFGVIAEKVPDFLASKTRTGVASIYMAGFTLAGVKYLHEENKALKASHAALEARLAALEKNKKAKP